MFQFLSYLITIKGSHPVRFNFIKIFRVIDCLVLQKKGSQPVLWEPKELLNLLRSAPTEIKDITRFKLKIVLSLRCFIVPFSIISNFWNGSQLPVLCSYVCNCSQQFLALKSNLQLVMCTEKMSEQECYLMFIQDEVIHN